MQSASPSCTEPPKLAYLSIDTISLSHHPRILIIRSLYRKCSFAKGYIHRITHMTRTISCSCILIVLLCIGVVDGPVAWSVMPSSAANKFRFCPGVVLVRVGSILTLPTLYALFVGDTTHYYVGSAIYWSGWKESRF